MELQQGTRLAQKQVQKLSQVQVQALRFLAIDSGELREEIYKAVRENPALEIVRDRPFPPASASLKDTQATLESNEDKTETLQEHLLHQLNSMRLPSDELELSKKLIYNLDKNGCYGSMLDPVTLLDRTRPSQDKKMLARCMERIQAMDPVGTCCKTPEESLFVQAKLDKNAPELALFLLDGHLELASPPEPEKILKKLSDFKAAYHKKTFAGTLALDSIRLTQDTVTDALSYILSLNPHPAQGYVSDTNALYEQPDIVLTVTKQAGSVPESDFSRGIVAGNSEWHFLVKYASGILPEVRLSTAFSFDKESTAAAKAFLESLQFRESTVILQGCAIVSEQKAFFLGEQDAIAPLTRRKVAALLGIHESTVSRMAGKKSSKYIQTGRGIFPASYFFSSGVTATGGKTVSSQEVQQKIRLLLQKSPELSDSKITRELNSQGISISRRTVAKYRAQAGIANSYSSGRV